MAKKKSPTRKKETDSEYIFKLVLYLIVGSIWLKITTDSGNQVPVPIGFGLGLIFASREYFQLDRKIEYAVLLMAMLIGFWLPFGIYINM